MISYETGYNEFVKFSDWITDKFIEWRGRKTGNSGSIAEFSKQFGASHQLVSQWMKPNSKPPRSQKYINSLIEMYGTETYEALGLSSPEVLDIPLDALPTELREGFFKAVDEIKSAFAAKQIDDPDSPEGKSLAVSIFEKHGFKVTTIL